jgi:hypothetical protein
LTDSSKNAKYNIVSSYLTWVGLRLAIELSAKCHGEKNAAVLFNPDALSKGEKNVGLSEKIG